MFISKGVCTMKILLDGEWRVLNDGMNALDLAAELGGEIKKKALAALVDGEVVDLKLPLRYRSRPGALRVLVPAGPDANSDHGATEG